MKTLTTEIKRKLRKIAKAKETEVEEILDDYKEVYQLVRKHYDVPQDRVSKLALRRVLGKMDISELTQVLLPPSTPQTAR